MRLLLQPILQWIVKKALILLGINAEEIALKNELTKAEEEGGSFAASVLLSWTTRAGLPVRGLRVTIQTHPSCAASCHFYRILAAIRAICCSPQQFSTEKKKPCNLLSYRVLRELRE